MPIISSKFSNCLANFFVALVVLLFCACGCSDNLSTEKEFKIWLRVIYERETGLQADEITIYLWERIPEEVLKKVPSLDGLKVEAMVFTFPSLDVPERDYFDLTVIHYVYCNYYKISDEWYLHAASWGGGFWEQDPEEWGHLVQDCKDRVEKFRGNNG